MRRERNWVCWYVKVRRAAICSSIIFHRSSATWSWHRCSCHSEVLLVQRSTSTEPPTRASASVSYFTSLLSRWNIFYMQKSPSCLWPRRLAFRRRLLVYLIVCWWERRQELIRRWDSERELFLRRYHTRTSEYQKREPTSFNKLDDS